MLFFFVFANSAVFIQTAGAADELAQTVSLIVKLINSLTPEEQAAVIARNGGSKYPPSRRCGCILLRSRK